MRNSELIFVCKYKNFVSDEDFLAMFAVKTELDTDVLNLDVWGKILILLTQIFLELFPILVLWNVDLYGILVGDMGREVHWTSFLCCSFTLSCNWMFWAKVFVDCSIFYKNDFNLFLIQCLYYNVIRFIYNTKILSYTYYHISNKFGFHIFLAACIYI